MINDQYFHTSMKSYIYSDIEITFSYSTLCEVRMKTFIPKITSIENKKLMKDDFGVETHVPLNVTIEMQSRI